jgi:hypothetical protein
MFSGSVELMNPLEQEFVFIAADGGEYGPVKGARLQYMIEAGTLSGDAKIRDPRTAHWTTWNEILQQAMDQEDSSFVVQTDKYAHAGSYDANSGWYYMQGSAQSGPHIVHHITYLYNNFFLPAEALVWHPNFGAEWKPLAVTGIINLRGVETPKTSRRQLFIVLGLAAFFWIAALTVLIFALSRKL